MIGLSVSLRLEVYKPQVLSKKLNKNILKLSLITIRIISKDFYCIITEAHAIGFEQWILSNTSRARLAQGQFITSVICILLMIGMVGLSVQY